MHRSPQKQLGVRRDRNTVYAAFELADDETVRPQQRGGQPKTRKTPRRDEFTGEERLARSPHPTRG
ncbi:MAG TPA: hypothetical protein VFE82_18800 [Ramlibacter sp.]|jgi:hypothetical protein|uniref:hypothetical protein n=1 Tax=Ramlibacter sp. TaxID=1917967 RepID=UPI002D2DA50C|nr:hypothetical protein [Ramlibacter sp.]HZY20526.1 hypothetical protein [Ramlibacter sp.]